MNLQFAINTKDVSKLVEANGVVPMLADWTSGSAEITESLNSLGSKSIPILAIFPAGHPEKVLVLRDIITKSQVIAALEQAGPSRDRQAANGSPRLLVEQ